MCGRFTLHARLNLLLQQFALEAGPEWAPRYNIAPTQRVPIIRARADGHRSDSGGGHELVDLRWGLVPTWAKELSIGNRMINARGETVASKPSFRSAFKRRRCLVPANGYFEWKKVADGKQPFYIRSRDEQPLAFAGLWEHWQPKEEGADAVETFTIITTDANELTASVHDRMPVVLGADDFPVWLDPEFHERETLEALLRPCDEDWLTVEPVSRHVNNPRHDDPSCIEPE